MFSTGHLIWIGISFALIILMVMIIRRIPHMNAEKLVWICLPFGIISEIIKIASVSKIVPMMDLAVTMQNGKPEIAYVPTGQYTPMFGAEELPFELCSIQLLFMILIIFIKDEKIRHKVYALMYPTGLIGGTVGILLSSITAYYPTTASYFTSVRVYQFFIYHAMLVALCICIGRDKKVNLTWKDYKTAVLGVLLLDIPTFYLNSVFSSKIYVNDELIGVTHRINFFSSYVNPLGIVLTEKWQWGVYLCIRFAIALSTMALVFLPFRKRKEIPIA